MKIPLKFQVFDAPVFISRKDYQRLAGYLSGWMRLAELLADINESDLMRLVVMELLGKQRQKIIDRLLMRLGRVNRNRIQARIQKCLPSKLPKPRSRKRS